MAALFVVSCVALNAVHQTASRLTWSFARDEALLFSNKLEVIHHSLGVPVLSLTLNWFLVLLVGIVYVCSSTGYSPRISPIANISGSTNAYMQPSTRS